MARAQQCCENKQKQQQQQQQQQEDVLPTTPLLEPRAGCEQTRDKHEQNQEQQQQHYQSGMIVSTNLESMPLPPAKRACVYHGSDGDGEGMGEASTGDENQQLDQDLEGDSGAHFGTIEAAGGFLVGGVTDISNGGGQDSSKVDGSNNSSFNNSSEGGSAREINGNGYFDERGEREEDTRNTVDNPGENGYIDGCNGVITDGGSGVNVVGSGKNDEGLRSPPSSSKDLEGPVSLKMEGEESSCEEKDRVDATQRSGGSFANDRDEKKRPEVGDYGSGDGFNADVRDDTDLVADSSNVGPVLGTQERRQEAVTSDSDGYYRVEDVADTNGIEIRNITATSSTPSNGNEYAFYGDGRSKGDTLCRSEAGRPFGLIDSSEASSGSGQGEASIGPEFSRSSNDDDDDGSGTKEGLNAEVNVVMSDMDADSFSGWDNDRT